jgi:hypothetical protein
VRPSRATRGMPSSSRIGALLVVAGSLTVMSAVRLACAEPSQHDTHEPRLEARVSEAHEGSAPRRVLCASPCPLAGFAQASVRSVTRESEAENGRWGRPTRGEKAKSRASAKAKGKPDGHDGRAHSPPGRVGAPLLSSAA